MAQSFPIKEAVLFGWRKVRAHSGLVFGVTLTMFALQVASSAVQRGYQDTLMGAVASVVLAVLGIFLGAGMTLIFLRLAKGEPARYRDIIPPVGLVWKYFCASLLTGIISFLPLAAGALAALALLLSAGAINLSEGTAVPGHGGAIAGAIVIMAMAACAAFYFAIRYSMARLVVIDGAGALESLSKSTALTSGVKWRIALFMLAILGLNILGLLALLVGLLVTIPVSFLAFAHVYLWLKERA
jgi:hypothetical protein